MTEIKGDPSAVVVPFGKHKGTTVAELLVRDPQYADWLMAQGWLAERFAGLHAAILSRGSAPDDTPEHNAIQVRFLDPAFCAAFLIAAGCKSGLDEMRQKDCQRRSSDLQSTYDEIMREVGSIPGRLDKESSLRQEVIGPRGGPRGILSRWIEGPPTEAELLYQADCQNDLKAAKHDLEHPPLVRLVTSCLFEAKGVDVTLTANYLESRYNRIRLRIEIKPSLGEDFPSVMRQMRASDCGHLVAGDYQGRSVSLPQLRQMFTANSQTLVMLADIEAELANARRLIEQDVAEALS